MEYTQSQICVIIGASHAGVNCAFALKNEGWQGKIILFDAELALPYHRPPLSKTFLTDNQGIENYCLKPLESYQKENIELRLDTKIIEINKIDKYVVSENGDIQEYDFLVLATGSQPIIPKIDGISESENVFTLRNANDVLRIKEAIQIPEKNKVIIIGGGYIGLEIGATLKKLGASVIILEREKRILARVTAPEISDFFQNLHLKHGVSIFTDKNVISIKNQGNLNQIICEDGSKYEANSIIVGVGVQVNLVLAKSIGLEIENGIKVDAQCRTSDENIFAIGDCTEHHNLFYNRFIRLESVQNANDQAKIAAATICGKQVVYDSIPWFWSDQFDIKLQMVGLSFGYNELIIRTETDENKLSAWYFLDDKLIAVDTINHAKAYVLGTKFIKEKKIINKTILRENSTSLTTENLLLQ